MVEDFSDPPCIGKNLQCIHNMFEHVDIQFMYHMTMVQDYLDPPCIGKISHCIHNMFGHVDIQFMYHMTVDISCKFVGVAGPATCTHVHLCCKCMCQAECR